MCFKRLGSRHIHKEIKLRKGMNEIDKIICKKDLKRLTCNTFNDVDFEAYFKSAFEPLCLFTISIKACFERLVVFPFL